MAETDDILVRLPRQTAQRLQAIVDMRGANSPVDIIEDALDALMVEHDEEAQIAAMIEQGFESKVWHDIDDVKASLRTRFAL